MSNSTIYQPEESSIYLVNSAGDVLAFHKHNLRQAHCVECQALLKAGKGFQRKMRNHPGSGYLCHLCAGKTLRKYQKFMFNRFNASLAPFDGVISVYAIPAAELAQAFHDHGPTGLRLTAEALREQARSIFLTERNIPFTPEKINQPAGVLA
jgi:hypothetical protein